MKFVSGIVVGIVIATIGISGVANILNRGVITIQNVAKEAAK